MAKRQMPDLSQLLTATAVPMADAAKALPQPPPPHSAKDEVASGRPHDAGVQTETATPNLENLNFKVPRSFRKRFRDCAYKADLKHNELLFAALDAWEAKKENAN